MAKNPIWRVLIVDDEVMMRRLLFRALSQQGFVCDSAIDGDEALKLVATRSYDAVVTDLKMPNQHGHALATHLLASLRRPVVIIHTGVVEPKLAKDLLARGVDDILFKPTDFSVLAAKVKALIRRRTEQLGNDDTPAQAASDAPAADSHDSTTTEQASGEVESPPTPQPELTESSLLIESCEPIPVDANPSARGRSLLEWVFNWTTA